MKIILSFSFFLFFGLLNAQFAPPVGHSGTTAISKDSSVFVYWADNASIQRGYVDISDKSKGYVTQGTIDDAFGKADNRTISLGDSGVVVYELNPPVLNGESWDFAVFENSFDDNFLELATVEVSSDGEHYSMFPPVSLTDTSEQTGTFGTLDATKIHNLAGKYRGGYGTPFDLDSLPDSNLLDKNNVRFVRITDVVGSIDARYARLDSRGIPINDPFPTPFESGGFDLDALGIIHQKTMATPWANKDIGFILYPSPAIDQLTVVARHCLACRFEILDYTGRKRLTGSLVSHKSIDISTLDTGVYFIKLFDTGNRIIASKPFAKMN